MSLIVIGDFASSHCSAKKEIAGGDDYSGHPSNAGRDRHHVLAVELKPEFLGAGLCVREVVGVDHEAPPASVMVILAAEFLGRSKR